MVVLDGPLMTSPSGHQYLQPDYLSPLPTTLDAKKSPLALLAQTCSQIGADSPTTKSLLPSLDKPKKTERASATPPKNGDTKSSTSSSPSGLAFKPYEANVLTTKKKEEPRRTPSRKSISPKSPTPEKEKEGASPIVRSGLEVLQGKDGFKPPLPPGCCPPGLETNPAFRPPYAHMLYPGWGYARVKTPSGAEALVPVCKDPYCAGCSLASSAHLGTCPPGCVQCDQHKYLASVAPALYSVRPYVCSWISSDKYCGQRFSSSDELLHHLRTHTTAAPDLAGPLRYPPPPALSPLPPSSSSPSSSARYHPYSKPPLFALPPSLTPYYPYLYPQRLVHP